MASIAPTKLVPYPINAVFSIMACKIHAYKIHMTTEGKLEFSGGNTVFLGDLPKRKQKEPDRSFQSPIWAFSNMQIKPSSTRWSHLDTHQKPMLLTQSLQPQAPRSCGSFFIGGKICGASADSGLVFLGA